MVWFTSSEKKNTKKKIAFKQLRPDYLFKQMGEKDPMQRGASRPRSERDKAEEGD